MFVALYQQPAILWCACVNMAMVKLKIHWLICHILSVNSRMSHLCLFLLVVSQSVSLTHVTCKSCCVGRYVYCAGSELWLLVEWQQSVFEFYASQHCKHKIWHIAITLTWKMKYKFWKSISLKKKLVKISLSLCVFGWGQMECVKSWQKLKYESAKSVL